jgi:hypothetical protein
MTGVFLCLHAFADSNIAIDASVFTNNVADIEGGAMLIIGEVDHISNVTITNSIFQNNTYAPAPSRFLADLKPTRLE